MPRSLSFRRRARLLAGGLLAGVLVAPAAAQAANLNDLAVRTSGGVLHFRATTSSSDSDPPSPTRRLDLFLPFGVGVRPDGFAACARRTVERRPADCPARSRLGSGTARVMGVNSAISPRPITTLARVAVFRGPVKGERPTLLFRLRADAPAPSWSETLEAVVAPERRSRSFRSRLAISVPDFGVIGLYQALVSLDVRLGAGAPGLVRTGGGCSDGTRTFRLVTAYYDRTNRRAGPARRADAEARC